MPESKKAGNGVHGDQSQKPLFTFGVISDVQYCDCDPVESRYYRSSRGRLREAVNSFKADSVNFIVNLGDLIDRGYESFKPVLDILDSSGLQVYNLTGNHDYSVDDRYKKRLPLKMQGKEGYYSFNYMNFRFIALDGNEISTYSTTNKAAIKKAEDYLALLKDSGNINAIDWNGGMSSKQLAWMRVQLDEATAKNENVFILCHFPVYPENVHNLLNYNEVNSILSNYKNIIAWFSGHNHAGNYGNFNMIHFVTMKGMVETEFNTSFAIIEVYRNKIWIKGAGREKSQILAY
ncbi:MAG: metallophosphoesterase [Bacteroidia bacterium]|nr:metallophosphoesterase [Bacteroidia bacterium]